MVSLENRYRGIPSNVTCTTPPGRMNVPSFEVDTPGPADALVVPAGNVNGGHSVAHVPVQVLMFLLSDVYVYSVSPDWSTRMVPSLLFLAVVTDTGVEDLAVATRGALDAVVAAPLEPHAAA